MTRAELLGTSSHVCSHANPLLALHLEQLRLRTLPIKTEGRDAPQAIAANSPARDGASERCEPA
jgi:hypothetical protein